MAGTIIEEDLTVIGNIESSDGSVEIKGTVVGDVTVGTVTIHPTGSIEGTLSAQDINIEGKLKGNLKGSNLKLAPTSQVQADIFVQTMTIENGAQISGKVKISGLK